MASSSDASRKRRRKAVVIEEDTFDAHRFKTPFHEHFFNSNVASKPIIPETRFNLEEDQYPQIRQQIELRGWKRLNKPKKRISQTIIREFYANARIDTNNEVCPRFHTFVRGMLVNFSMDRIKTIMKFKGPLNSETSYRARMVEGNQDLDAVTRDLCVEGAVWSLGARNNPLYLKRTSGPVEAMPKARSITPAVMENIRHPPVQPFNPQQYYHHEQPADGYGWGQLQEDMVNMSKNQTEFYDSMLAQQTAYRLRLQEMETRQQEMWQFQQEAWQAQHQFQPHVRNYQEQQREQFQSFQKEQEKMQKELTNYKKNFSSHMGRLHAAHEEQKTKMGQTNQILINHALDSQAGNMYTHWALQQSNQNLVSMIPTKIPPAIRDNFKAGRPLFHGMLRPWPPEGSSNALGQQATPAVDVSRNPNADADDED
ncbi:hypothetical protein PIB30_092510 [Stylosanthes scabra]|uniref:Putative plant transposon protein domain-containing protein n=1 Tax=Stylosanthes scabra TaxID=79078 RepID=A0ABU6UXD3_9FABA|nr:hypothetical protein [Stylosanthes scabra]